MAAPGGRATTAPAAAAQPPSWTPEAAMHKPISNPFHALKRHTHVNKASAVTQRVTRARLQLVHALGQGLQVAGEDDEGGGGRQQRQRLLEQRQGLHVRRRKHARAEAVPARLLQKSSQRSEREIRPRIVAVQTPHAEEEGSHAARPMAGAALWALGAAAISWQLARALSCRSAARLPPRHPAARRHLRPLVQPPQLPAPHSLQPSLLLLPHSAAPAQLPRPLC